jgi:hypothetical protein
MGRRICQASRVVLTINRRKPFQTAALGLSLLLPVAVRADDWAQFGGPNRDGAWNETGLLKSFPADGLKIRWRKPVSWGWSSPVVVQGRVFLTDAKWHQPAARERIHCLEETTGKLLWSYAYEVTHPSAAESAPGLRQPMRTDMSLPATTRNWSAPRWRRSRSNNESLR